MHSAVRPVELYGRSGYKDCIITLGDTAASDTLTIVTTRATYTFAEGTDFSAGGTAADSATNLARAIDDVEGFEDCYNVGAIIYLNPKPWVEGLAVSADDEVTSYTIATTTTNRYVSCGANSASRDSVPIRIGDAEYFNVAVQATVDSSGTPAYNLSFRVAATWDGIDKNGEPSNVAWGQWTSIVSGATGSDGEWYHHGATFSPPTSEWIQIRYTNTDATNAITATATTGLRGRLIIQ